MALCEGFKCKTRSRCKFRSSECEKTCLVALDIHKCSSCARRITCRGSERFERAMIEKYRRIGL